MYTPTRKEEGKCCKSRILYPPLRKLQSLGLLPSSSKDACRNSFVWKALNAWMITYGKLDFECNGRGLFEGVI